MYFFFFDGKGSRQLELLLVEAANGVTPAIQGLNICSGVITPRILGEVFTPRILGGGVNNPNSPLMAATDDIQFVTEFLCFCIFATEYRRRFIFQNVNSNRPKSLKYQRFADGKDIRIKKQDMVSCLED